MRRIRPGQLECRYARGRGGMGPAALGREGEAVTPEAVAADPDTRVRVAGWADLRRPPSDAVLDEVIERVEAGLRTTLDREGLLRK
jgi:hypothetical protein